MKPLFIPGAINILIACEESDTVRSRFQAKGFNAVSCDLQPSRNPEAKHYQGDLFDIIGLGWDMMIAFPPCTHLCVSGARHFDRKKADGRQAEAVEFFLKVWNSQIPRICIENPVGIMSSHFRKPDQIIHPYYFGDSASKRTCLWLKNMPKLVHVKEPNLFEKEPTHVYRGDFVASKETGSRMPAWYAETSKLSTEERSKARSKTFNGIAYAMCEQWSKLFFNE